MKKDVSARLFYESYKYFFTAVYLVEIIYSSLDHAAKTTNLLNMEK